MLFKSDPCVITQQRELRFAPNAPTVGILIIYLFTECWNYNIKRLEYFDKY